MYHQVSPHVFPTFRKYTVTPSSFARQMGWLASAGYMAISLDMLFDARAGQTTLPAKPVIITFDDGFQGCVDYAIPILLQHHFTAIFYLVAGLMGKPSVWLEAERGITMPLMDLPTAREIANQGFVCGAHTMTHPRLAQLDADVCQNELHESRQYLQDELGQPVKHLAYPFGSFNASVRACAAELGYRSACSTMIGRSPCNDDPFALHRVPVCGQDTLLDFICRLRTARTVREFTRDGVLQLQQQLWSRSNR